MPELRTANCELRTEIMCTVTYIPNKDGFILTSNRDENAARSPKNITRIDQNGTELVFPRDTTAGGTWIAVSETNRMVCVLNGAFDKHKHRPPYRRSRGLLVLDFFNFPNAESFFEEVDFLIFFFFDIVWRCLTLNKN